MKGEEKDVRYQVRNKGTTEGWVRGIATGFCQMEDASRPSEQEEKQGQEKEDGEYCQP